MMKGSKNYIDLLPLKMFSPDDGIGLAVLFSYHYFKDTFTVVYKDFDKTNSISDNNYTILKNKLC